MLCCFIPVFHITDQCPLLQSLATLLCSLKLKIIFLAILNTNYLFAVVNIQRSSVLYFFPCTAQLGQLLAATCKELPGPKESRRTAKDLWEVVVQICSVSNQHKRGNDGRVSLIKHRESTLGIMYRCVSLNCF